VTGLYIPQIYRNYDMLTAALKYAEGGFYVLPVKRGSKHPGSIVGNDWPRLSSRDPQLIVAWFAGATHVASSSLHSRLTRRLLMAAVTCGTPSAQYQNCLPNSQPCCPTPLLPRGPRRRRR
jgi:hypothetical protein